MPKLPPIAIFGTSSFAKKIVDIGTLLGHDAFVLLRPDADSEPETVRGWPVRPESEAEALHRAGHVFALGIGDGAIRKKVAAGHAGLSFVNIVHPAATFGTDRDAVLAKARGLVVEAGARLCPDIEIGDFCVVNLNATIGHDCVLGDYVTVSPGANVLGNVTLDEGASVGAGAVIMPGRTRKMQIGAWSKIGPMAWITADVPAGMTMACLPAKKFEIIKDK
jgi:sugar O-acyltransferase (sialic acid O-acetyltransferase NeuD family)